MDAGLISIDQEKAFVQVEHQYSWHTFEKFGLVLVFFAGMLYAIAIEPLLNGIRIRIEGVTFLRIFLLLISQSTLMIW